MIRKIIEIAEGHGLRVVVVAHANDGNIHPMIPCDKSNAEEWAGVGSLCRHVHSAYQYRLIHPVQTRVSKTALFWEEAPVLANCRFSVIIASYNARSTIGACLEPLDGQADPDIFEIIVVDSSTDGTAEWVERNFPGVRISRFSERKFCGDARNIGIARARGEIVAFLDADCLAGPAWIEEILKAHRSPVPAIGGAITNGNPESLVGWAAYFTEFSKKNR